MYLYLEGHLFVGVDIPLYKIVPADIFIVCVPTPFFKETAPPKPDLSFLYEAIDQITSVLKNGDTILIESTSPVGTTKKILEHIKNRKPIVKEFYLAYCPERVLPGNTFQELINVRFGL